MKSPAAYMNENISYDRKMNYFIPLVFYLKSGRTVGEFKVQLVLSWNKNTNEWVFNICDKEKTKGNILSDVIEPESKIMNWLLEDGTVISRIEMLPHSRINIPSGIYANLPENIYLKAENKSGIASKRGLVFAASVVDYDYQGEIHIGLINSSELNVFIEAGEKIIQFLPCFQPIMKVVKEFDSLDKLFEDKKSERGAGGFGSSGKN